jgi:hypothetical protein
MDGTLSLLEWPAGSEVNLAGNDRGAMRSIPSEKNPFDETCRRNPMVSYPRTRRAMQANRLEDRGKNVVFSGSSAGCMAERNFSPGRVPAMARTEGAKKIQHTESDQTLAPAAP